MATLQEIEDGIRKLHKLDPNDPRIKVLGEARAKMLAGGGAPAEGPGLMERMANSMAETGRNVRESVMNPGQSIPDLLRSSSDFVSFGLTDRLRSAFKGTDLEEERAETQAADTRLGSIDDAFNLGTAVMQPSAAERYAARGGNMLTKALGYGGEGAALAGVDAVGHGQNPINPMLFGGGAGAAGSLGADAFEVASNFRNRNNPKYPTDESLLSAYDTVPEVSRGENKGAKAPRDAAEKEITQGGRMLEKARMAQTQGSAGFADMLRGMDKIPNGQAGVTRDIREQVSRLASGRKAKSVVEKAGSAIGGGAGALVKLPWAYLTGGAGPVAGGITEAASAGMKDYSPKLYKQLTATIRDIGERGEKLPPGIVEAMRAMLAKAGASAGRGNNAPAFVDPKTIDSWKK